MNPFVMGNSPLLSLVSFTIHVLYTMKVILAILDKIAHHSLSPHRQKHKHAKRKQNAIFHPGYAIIDFSFLTPDSCFNVSYKIISHSCGFICLI